MCGASHAAVCCTEEARVQGPMQQRVPHGAGSTGDCSAFFSRLACMCRQALATAAAAIASTGTPPATRCSEARGAQRKPGVLSCLPASQATAAALRCVAPRVTHGAAAPPDARSVNGESGGRLPGCLLVLCKQPLQGFDELLQVVIHLRSAAQKHVERRWVRVWRPWQPERHLVLGSTLGPRQAGVSNRGWRRLRGLGQKGSSRAVAGRARATATQTRTGHAGMLPVARRRSSARRLAASWPPANSSLSTHLPLQGRIGRKQLPALQPALL